MLSKGLILVIDDDRPYTETLQGILEEEGYVVRVANDGKDAVDILSRIGPRVDLITLDIEMPGMHGLEFLQRVERINKKIPIIMASSKKGLKNDIHVQSSPQVKTFLEKPYNLNHLLAILPDIVADRSGQPGTRLLVVGDSQIDELNQMLLFFESNGFIVRVASEREALVGMLRNLGDAVDGVVVEMDMLANRDKWVKMDEDFVYLERIEASISDIPIYVFTAQQREREPFYRFKKVREVLKKPVNLKPIADQLRREIDDSVKG